MVLSNCYLFGKLAKLTEFLFKALVSKGTVMLRRWGSEMDLSTALIW